VYAMSSLSTAIVFWLACKWDARAEQPDSNRWLLLIAYVIGLSIGIHLLNLLTIPAIAIFIYFRKVKTVSFKGMSRSFAYGVLILAFILWGVIQYSVKIAAYFDLFFVNNLQLPFGSGILVFICLLITALVLGIRFSIKKNKPMLNMALLCISFIYLGFGAYAMLAIRSQTNISLNNYEPSHAFSFLGYLSREQYQTEPLLKGPNFNAKVVGIKSDDTYRKGDANYEKVKANGQYLYDEMVLFPRLYSEKHSQFYQQYLGLKEGQDPTFLDQLNFFFNYQLGHMYARYFLWNFAGRQNNSPSQGEYSNGNWISGFNALDAWRLPGFDADNSLLTKDPSRKTYFFIPLILGVIGLIWQLRKSKRDTLVIGLLFFFTGIAIVIYLNQTPMQPRERDYAYVGSFYAFAIWIGLGFIGLMHGLKKMTKINPKLLSIGLALLCLFMGPIRMLKENWTDHDRSARMLTREMAINTLNSCEQNAILFTYADNDSFPLWYLQEVEGIRQDVRVINFGYLQSDWYVKQAMSTINQAESLPLNFSYDQVKKGVRDGMLVMDMGIQGYTDLDQLLQVMLSDDNSNKIQMRDGTFENVLPTRKLQLKIDKDAVIANAVVPKDWEENIPDLMQWEYNQNHVSRAELSLMSILVNNEWKRPIYFTSASPSAIFMGMDKYLASEGLVYKLMPVEVGQPVDHQSIVNGERI
ncbi:MAG: protein O-mannosyl-transferase family, partial [Sphingobacterium sp.]